MAVRVISLIFTSPFAPAKFQPTNHFHLLSFSFSPPFLSQNLISMQLLSRSVSAMPMQKYIYPDPIPEFAKAVSVRVFLIISWCILAGFLVFMLNLVVLIVGCNLQETMKFRAELLEKLSREKDTFGDDLDDVVAVCVEVILFIIRNEYLLTSVYSFFLDFHISTLELC